MIVLENKIFAKLLGFHNVPGTPLTGPYQPIRHGNQVDKSDNILITYEKFPISFDFDYCKRFVDLACICQKRIVTTHSELQPPERFAAAAACSKSLCVASIRHGRRFQ